MGRVQRNFRAKDMLHSGVADAPKAPEQAPAPVLDEPVHEEPKKAPAKRGPKSTKPKAEVDPNESAPVVDGSTDATHKE